jgi:hypothetical protein
MIGGNWCFGGKKKEGFKHQNTKKRKPLKHEKNDWWDLVLWW